MLYQTVVFIHVLSAVIWVGGMLFLVMVLVPLSRRGMKAGGATGELLRQSTQKFLPVAWLAMGLLVVTGIYIGWDHWGVRPGNFFSTGGHFFRILQIKTGLFVLVIVLSLVHDFLLGPRVLSRLESAPIPNSSTHGKAARGLLLTLARVNLLAVLIILVLAVLLVRP
jgi:uncharacterized membrane protein